MNWYLAACRAEFLAVRVAVLLAPYSALRHPALFFTVSDFFFFITLALRGATSWTLRPLGAATLFWLGGVILLIYGLLISSLFNGDIFRGFIVFLQYLFAYVGLPWAICGRSYKDAETLAKCAVYSMIIMCLIGIGAYAWGYNGGYARHFAIVSGSGRLSSLVDNPNGLAGLIAFTFPVLWYLTGVGTFRLLTAAILSVPLFYALILTSSNTGLISTSVAMIVFLVGRGKIKLFLAGLVFAAGVFGAVHIWGQQILPAVFQKRVLSAFTDADISEAGTFESRYDLMAEAWRLADHTCLWAWALINTASSATTACQFTTRTSCSSMKADSSPWWASPLSSRAH